MVLGKLQTQIYADLQAASPSYAPSTSTVFRQFSQFFFFGGRNAGIQDMKGTIKNETKCHENLITYIKAMMKMKMHELPFRNS